MSQELCGFATEKGIYVTSKHKCYKGKWYYSAKNRLATIRENFAALQEKYNAICSPATAPAVADRRAVLNSAIKTLKELRDGEVFADLTINDAIDTLREFRDNG